MSKRRVGLWLIGAFGGVGTTAALGLAALGRGLTDTTSLVTALPLFDGLDLDGPTSSSSAATTSAGPASARPSASCSSGPTSSTPALIDACQPDLDAWERERPARHRPQRRRRPSPSSPTCPRRSRPRRRAPPSSASRPTCAPSARRNQLDQVVVVNVASTEPPFEIGDAARIAGAAARRRWSGAEPVAAGQLAVRLGRARPGLALHQLHAVAGGVVPGRSRSWPRSASAVIGGKDGKTGETLLKTVLAPMFALRNWQILSWVGHNIFGNRDGMVLDDPANKASKIQTKDQVISSIVGYKPQTHVSIEYIESLDDWKTAWDHIHFRGFLGTKMILQFIWQGCDSMLAAPLVLDLARLALLAQRRGEVGVLHAPGLLLQEPDGRRGARLLQAVRHAGRVRQAVATAKDTIVADRRESRSNASRLLTRCRCAADARGN